MTQAQMIAATNTVAATPEYQSRSLLRTMPALVLFAIVVANLGNYADTDLWGHIYFGNIFLAHGPHFGTEPFSYSAGSHPWLDHEWLCEMLMAGLYDRFGVVGLQLWKLVCVAATIFFVATSESETNASISLPAVILMAAAFALVPYMQFRPQLFSFLMFAALIAAIARDINERRAPFWLAVPGAALWANLHGGYFVGIGTLALYASLRCIVDLMQGRGITRGVGLGAIAIAATLATLATPFGIHGWYTIAREVTNPLTRKVMVDWRPIWVVYGDSHVGAIPVLLFIGIALPILLALTFAFAPELNDLPLVIIATLMAISGLLVVRNVPFAVIAACAPLAHHASAAVQRLGHQAKAPGSFKASGAAWVVLQSIAAMLTLMLAIRAGLFSDEIPAAIDYPVGAVAFMRTHELHGNLLNFFDWGQYLIWHTTPESKVFIDGRYDLAYPAKVTGDYIDFYYARRPQDAAVLAAYPHDYVLIQPESAVFALMNSRKDWKLVYRDSVCALFARINTPAAKLAPMIRAAPASYFP